MLQVSQYSAQTKPTQLFLKINLHMRNYCTVNKDAVAVRRSDWPRAKSDHAFCKRTMTNPAAMAEAKFGLPLLSSGVFKEFETRQQKKKLA